MRSDKYEQASGKLENGTGFCCLGVACKVAEQHGVPVDSVDGFIIGEDLHSQLSVKTWLGVNTYAGCFSDTSLARLNDNGGLSFKQIADVIENNWEELTDG